MDISFNTNFHFWWDANLQIPALMVTAAIYTSGNIGPEFTASARTLCEVFHDIAPTMGKCEFS